MGRCHRMACCACLQNSMKWRWIMRMTWKRSATILVLGEAFSDDVFIAGT